MTDNELYLLASFFIENGGSQPTLHRFAAEYLDTTNLVRWQAAFTQAQVNPYVGAYAPLPVSTGYFDHPALRAAVHAAPTPPPANPPGTPPNTPPPNPFASWQTDLQELYSEFRLSGDSVLTALAKIGKFAAGEVYGAWKLGDWAGTTFYNAMVSIDPSYGYDLMVYGGGIMWESGLPTPVSSAGEGYAEGPDGVWYDGYGNVVPPPTITNYGIPSSDGTVTFDPPWTFWDPYGDCLLGLDCGD